MVKVLRTRETGDREGNPSTASLYGVSATSILLSSGLYANNGFANGSVSGKSALPSTSATLPNFKNVANDGDHNWNSSTACAVFATSVPNAESGITSGGSVTLLSNLFGTLFSSSLQF